MGSSVLRALADQVLVASAPGAAPQLPTVGRVVHYYTGDWQPEGPYAAVVSGVRVMAESAQEIVAQVDLTVFGNDSYHLVQLYKDVPALAPGAEHANLAHWWTWPPRSS